MGKDLSLKERSKKPFDIDSVIKRIRKSVVSLRKAALFELYDQGHISSFEILMACIISIRTYDEVTVPSAQRLFALARSPETMSQLSIEAIDKAIRPCTFHEGKAKQIRSIAAQIVEKYGNTLPCDREVLLSFYGVGPKCAHLALGIACHQPFISVDTHVHRVTNRWGYVAAKTPEKTMAALEAILPKVYWIEINRLLVPFGKNICTGLRPHCSICPVLDMCQQVGVSHHR